MVLTLSLLVVLLTTAGQLFLKFGAIKSTVGQLFNRYLLIGYLFFFIVVLISWLLMGMIDMKYFAALMSANYVAVALASRVILNEIFGWRRAIGTLVVAAGVLIFVIS